MKKYKIKDKIKLKTYDELFALSKNNIKDDEQGFYLKKSKLYINSEMYKYLGKEYQILNICNIDDYRSTTSMYSKGYNLKNITGWTWNEECFEEENQLEFDFK